MDVEWKIGMLPLFVDIHRRLGTQNSHIGPLIVVVKHVVGGGTGGGHAAAKTLQECGFF
jgi:hypothetical protein